ncbi:hypothetical protein QE109_05495 [Fusibacter bizertensis]|uniref:Flagellin Flp1-like domain-containing protein n=1 Tax=Fusibacter bizertensis TaxID=1488331 RepID=A0ABT6NB14_9FIRM|nr:hypothetical protein [Fusibacter bizertensis]MDH8677589.1 hypothetical protein [Fusibacter bizertensis]
MGSIKYEWIGIIFFFIILVSIQFSLNKIIILLKELIQISRSKK